MANAKEIKTFLKENGIDTQNIRVSAGSSIEVKLLDPKLDYDLISELLAGKYESYRRDEATGDILSGGNTFVFVEFDHEVIQGVRTQLQGTIRPFLENCKGYWSIHSLVNHYVETIELEFNKNITKKALRESLYSFFKEDPNSIDGLLIDGWN